MRRCAFVISKQLGGAVLMLALVVAAASCRRTTFVFDAAAKNVAALFRPPSRVANKIRDPVRPEARLAALWIGHATVLLQIEDRFVLTDPVFTSSVGQISHRLVEPGIEPDRLPPLDAVLISHMHFDHLSVGTLDLLQPKIRHIVVPEGGLVYLPDSAIDAQELPTFRSIEWDGLRVTAVPVKHAGFRYGVDDAWMTRSFTGYVIEYRGSVVYFGGDTAYDARLFALARRRFPRIDLALLPIAPIHPRSRMREIHMDPAEAVRAFGDLGARRMLPIHYGTFINSLDAPDEPLTALRGAMRRSGLTDRDVVVLRIGEQRVFERRPAAR